MDWREIALSTVVSSGVAYGAARFLIEKIAEARIKYHYDKKLEELKTESAKDLATFSDQLKSDSEAKLATLSSELKERGETRLANLTSGLKERGDNQLAELNAELAKRNNETLAELNRKYAGEIEEAKAKLLEHTQAALEVLKLRLQLYQPLGEDIYRVRNLAREMLTLAKPSEYKKEYDERLLSLQNRLMQLRVLLDGDRVFLPIHAYKNDAVSFRMQIESYLASGPCAGVDLQAAASKALRPIYERMDSQYQEITAALAALIKP